MIIAKRSQMDKANQKESQKQTGKSRQIPSSLEMLFVLQLRALKLPQPLRNYRFLPDRKYEFDFAWQSLMLAVECQGMAHRIKGKFEADLEKRALALLAGWTVLEVGGKQVRSGQAIKWLFELINQRRIAVGALPIAYFA